MREDEAETLRDQLQRYIRRHRRERPRVDGLSEVPARMLGTLARAGAPLRSSEIAERSGQASSNVAAALRELEAGGYVVRKRGEQDRRQVSVTLTELGRAAVATHRAVRTQWLQAAADATLTAAEQRTLLEAGVLLDRMARWDGATAGRSTDAEPAAGAPAPGRPTAPESAALESAAHE